VAGQGAAASIPGHEGVGIVERVGPGNAHGIVEGMRVALPWLGYACGDCAYCNTGWETLCESQQNMGYSMNGGFAEYAVGYARHVVAVPDGIDPLDAAPLTCAGVTTYKAVKVSGARSSDLVAVFGAGGLGHLAIQYAAITGAAVVAVDINVERLEAARALGAEYVVHAGEDPVAAIQRLGGARAAISTAVSPIAFQQALGSLRRGGTLVCIGLPADNEMKLPIFETVLGGLTVRGSIVGTHRDLEEVFDLHRCEMTSVFRSTVALNDVNEAIEQCWMAARRARGSSSASAPPSRRPRHGRPPPRVRTDPPSRYAKSCAVGREQPFPPRQRVGVSLTVAPTRPLRARRRSPRATDPRTSPALRLP
jgi:propanol-preferring alcohol dehydrogenase